MPVAQVNVPRADGAGGIAVSVFQLDANGFVMQPLDPRLCVVPLAQMNAQLPVITGLNVFQLQPGHRVESPQAQAALQLIGAFDHSPMAGLVDLQRVDVSSPGVVVATTGQGSEITFGLDNLEQQLARWREIYDLGQQHEQNDRVAGSGGGQQCSGSLDGGNRFRAGDDAEKFQTQQNPEEKCLTIPTSLSAWKSARQKFAPSSANKTPTAR